MRRGVALCGPLQRFDEAEQRGQGRAQLVAGIGDEVDPHGFELHRLRAVPERDERRRTGTVGGTGRPQRAGAQREGPFDRAARDEFDVDGGLAAQRALHRLDRFGHAQREGDRTPRPQRGKGLAGRPVGEDDRRAAVDEDHGIGQRFERFDEQVVPVCGQAVHEPRPVSSSSAASLRSR